MIDHVLVAHVGTEVAIAELGFPGTAAESQRDAEAEVGRHDVPVVVQIETWENRALNVQLPALGQENIGGSVANQSDTAP